MTCVKKLTASLPRRIINTWSNIFYLDFSDDPWAEASVKKAGGEALPFCFTKCDGCGHCGAGVPASKRECFDKSYAFVDGVLEKWRRGE